VERTTQRSEPSAYSTNGLPPPFRAGRPLPGSQEVTVTPVYLAVAPMALM
jgi:hypothetical protein